MKRTEKEVSLSLGTMYTRQSGLIHKLNLVNLQIELDHKHLKKIKQ